MRRFLLALVLLGAQAVYAQDAQPFRANDVVAYVGDSITHGGTYHSIVTLFYATRFPDRPIRFYNEGIGGDRASGIMSDEHYRLNADILGHKPTAASIMLGMNDVNRTDYGAGKTGPEFEQKHAHYLELYHENMQKLIEALQKSGARLILITPSIYDEAPQFANGTAPEPTTGSNAALGECARQVREFAKQYHTGLVDFWGEMNAVNAEQRKKDPLFSIVGPNRVHPGPVGHFVMAYAFLKAQGLAGDVAVVGVSAKKKAADHAENCKIEKVQASKTGVEFDALENALPLVVPDEAKPALPLVPFEDQFNREMLRVDGLKKGKYKLTIDGAAIGEYAADELKKGVNLAENPATPQYKQSAEVTRINTDRNKVAAALRDLAGQKYGLSRAKVDVLDHEALLKHVQEQVAAAKTPHDAAYTRLTALLKDAEEPGKLEAHYEDLMAQMYKTAQTHPHHYVLAREAAK
jgi:lysophospholipase L1-like esterase